MALAFLLPVNADSQPSLFGKRDDLKGPVRSVRSETARVSSANDGKELSRVKVEAISYNRERKATERSIYDDYGFYLGRETYHYDSKGWLSQENFYDSKSNLIETRIYSRDPHGKTIGIKTVDKKGQISRNRDYKHDINGNWVEELIQNSSEIVGKRISKFDSKGNITEVAHYNGQGLLQEKWLFGYDGETGNPTWEALYNSDGSLRKKLLHNYELDPKGNWIKRITSVHTVSPMSSLNESIFVTYRTITYY